MCLWYLPKELDVVAVVVAAAAAVVVVVVVVEAEGPNIWVTNAAALRTGE